MYWPILLINIRFSYRVKMYLCKKYQNRDPLAARVPTVCAGLILGSWVLGMHRYSSKQTPCKPSPQPAEDMRASRLPCFTTTLYHRFPGCVTSSKIFPVLETLSLSHLIHLKMFIFHQLISSALFNLYISGWLFYKGFEWPEKMIIT